MKINTLKYLITLSESKSINEASQKLFITQPCLTKALNAMEEELGFVLFVRKKTGIALTEDGKRILQDAKKIVEIYDSWLNIHNTPELPSIKIYGYVSFSDFIVPVAIYQIKGLFPDLEINFRSVPNPEQYISSDISEPNLIIDVCDNKMLANYTNIQGTPPIKLMDGEYMCLVNKASPLAKMKSITLDALKDMNLMIPVSAGDVRSEGAFLESVMTNIINYVGKKHVIEVDTLQNVIDSVAMHNNAYAVSYYPALERYQKNHDNQLVAIPFKDQKTKGSLCLFYSDKAAAAHPVLNTVIDTLLQQADNFLEEHNINI
ncbi:MAG: LysR family transcriptional regulator [Eubacteriales bacterium]|nr:LysR family transcriptional regulator [Eubacteriales bacterium]